MGARPERVRTGRVLDGEGGADLGGTGGHSASGSVVTCSQVAVTRAPQSRVVDARGGWLAAASPTRSASSSKRSNLSSTKTRSMWKPNSPIFGQCEAGDCVHKFELAVTGVALSGACWLEAAHERLVGLGDEELLAQGRNGVLPATDPEASPATARRRRRLPLRSLEHPPNALRTYFPDHRGSDDRRRAGGTSPRGVQQAADPADAVVGLRVEISRMLAPAWWRAASCARAALAARALSPAKPRRVVGERDLQTARRVSTQCERGGWSAASSAASAGGGWLMCTVIPAISRWIRSRASQRPGQRRRAAHQHRAVQAQLDHRQPGQPVDQRPPRGLPAPIPRPGQGHHHPVRRAR